MCHREIVSRRVFIDPDVAPIAIGHADGLLHHTRKRLPRFCIDDRRRALGADAVTFGPRPRLHEFRDWRNRCCKGDDGGSTPIAAILVPAGFFLSVLPPDAKAPNGLIYLAYVGAVLLALGVLVLGVGLVRSGTNFLNGDPRGRYRRRRLDHTLGQSRLPRRRQTVKLGVALALGSAFDAAILDPRRSTVITLVKRSPVKLPLT